VSRGGRPARRGGGRPFSPGALVVQYAAPRRGLPARRTLERLAALAGASGAQLTIRFVGRAEGRRLNRTYRARDHATNVLTFVYSTRPVLAGDVVLCAPVVAAEARAQAKALAAHYAHLVLHGLLHLRGYDHERAPERERMEARERAILARLGYPDPYLMPRRAPS
jgi:probable rRNA maturation factor